MKLETPLPEPQASIRHHYIPVFYLNRWRSGDDKKICEYSRPHKAIYDRRIHPVQTGFQDRLYEKKGVPKIVAQQVEDDFMKSVDTLASEALRLIETGDAKIDTDAKHRSAWSLFLISLMTRMPEDVEALAGILDDDWERDLPRVRQEYAKTKKLDDPPTLEEFIEQKDPDHMARWTMNVLPEVMDHAKMGQSLNAMRWFVVTLAAEAPALLSSDRPLFLSGALGAADCYLTLPIAADKLFIAVNSAEMEQKFKAQPQKELIHSTNLQVAKQAAKYVYGGDNSASDFVDKYISTDRPKCFFERLRKFRKAKYAPCPS
ncbi:DUF4238 domain-containing protein [Bradyrhizobium sp. USDA 372]